MTPADPRGVQREPAQQKTDLEVFLRVRGPELLRKHAANIILGVLIVAAIVVFFVSRTRTKAANAAIVAQRTADAYDAATQARTALESPNMSPEANRQRQTVVQRALESADQILNSPESTSSQRAIAQLAKADVYWDLANTPAEALTTTQPVFGFEAKDNAAYLRDAEAAYTEILSKYTDMKLAVGNALLGLAAIAEDRHEWDKASEWYQRVIDDASLPAQLHDVAKAKQLTLVDLRQPFALAAPSTQPLAGDVTPLPMPNPTPLILQGPTSAPAAGPLAPGLTPASPTPGLTNPAPANPGLTTPSLMPTPSLAPTIPTSQPSLIP